MLRVIFSLIFFIPVSVLAIVQPPVVFLSDYGLLDESVGVCKGVVISYNAEAKIIDLTHQVPAFSVKDASRYLAAATPYYPEGAIFMALVEKPGGKKTKKLVALTKKGQFILAPNDGLITLVADREGISEVREIVEGEWIVKKDLESNFPGRDVYAKVAAHLSKKEDWKKVGPVLEKWERMETKKSEASKKGTFGEILAVDGVFGNLVSNLSVMSLLNAGYTLGDTVRLRIADKPFEMKFVKTFEDVPMGSFLIYIDTTDHASLAINQGNFAGKHKIKVGAKVILQNKANSRE